MLTPEYLADFRRKSEARWRSSYVKPDIAGFQFHPDTCWNPGLTHGDIADFERNLGFRFCTDLQCFLREMNGTDLATINVHGGSVPERVGLGVYAYPRDLDAMRSRLEDVNRNRREIVEDLTSQGFPLPDDAHLYPFYAHRYVVCGSDPSHSTVLSIAIEAVDAIVYADSLQTYLEREFLHPHDTLR